MSTSTITRNNGYQLTSQHPNGHSPECDANNPDSEWEKSVIVGQCAKCDLFDDVLSTALDFRDHDIRQYPCDGGEGCNTPNEQHDGHWLPPRIAPDGWKLTDQKIKSFPNADGIALHHKADGHSMDCSLTCYGYQVNGNAAAKSETEWNETVAEFEAAIEADHVFEDGFLESAMGWKLEYDEIEKSEVITGLDGIKPRGTWNATEFQVMHDAARAQFKSKMGKETFQRMLSVACYKNRFHRIRDHIASLPTWTGEKRIDRIMPDGWGMDYDDDNIRQIHSLYLHHFFVGAIRKVATPERKHHQVLTLTGEGGGQGKSTFAEIVGYDDIGLYADIGFPPDSKTVIEWTRGSWIVEISELAGSQRQNWDVINHVLSTNRDVARLAYDRNTTSRDREFVFIASTNNLGFIKGRDGIRRWNPIDVTSRSLNKRWLRDNRNQIWAEAKHYAEDPEWQSFVDRDDQDVFARMNAYVESYVEVIPEVSIVEAAIQGLGDTLQLTELRRRPDLADIKPSLITASLKRVGFRSRVVRLDDGRQVRAWVKA